MLRHTLRVRSALGHFRSAPFQTVTRLLHDSDNSPPTYNHASIDHRLNKLQSDMKDMSMATDDKLKGLDDRHAMEIKGLGDKLTIEIKELSMEIKGLFMEIKALGTNMDARFETSNAKAQSKSDMLRVELKDREARFWARAIFTVLAVAGLTSSAAFLQYQNRAIQTPAVQAPVVGQK